MKPRGLSGRHVHNHADRRFVHGVKCHHYCDHFWITNQPLDSRQCGGIVWATEVRQQPARMFLCHTTATSSRYLCYVQQSTSSWFVFSFRCESFQPCGLYVPIEYNLLTNGMVFSYVMFMARPQTIHFGIFKHRMTGVWVSHFMASLMAVDHNRLTKQTAFITSIPLHCVHAPKLYCMRYMTVFSSPFLSHSSLCSPVHLMSVCVFFLIVFNYPYVEYMSLSTTTSSPMG